MSRVVNEIAAHPAETVALVAMGVAAARLLSRKEGSISLPPDRSHRRSRRLAPITMMAAICLMMVAGCVSDKVVRVSPDPQTFERAYDDNLVAAGEKLARERCADCHSLDRAHRRGSAPLMTELVPRRGADKLTDDLVAGSAIYHGGMPTFDFNVTAAIALVAYLEAIAKSDAS